MREWNGLKVPFEPCKWMGDWMLKGRAWDCPGFINCKIQSIEECKSCIYSADNSKERKQFYKECFKVNAK